MVVSAGPYAWMLIAGRLERLVIRWMCRVPNRRPAPSPSSRAVIRGGAVRAGGDRVLGEGAGEDVERAGRAAVVVQVGALAGQPGQQPHLVVGLLAPAGGTTGRPR